MNPAKDWFHCWHCGFSGRSLAALMVSNSPEQREYLAGRPATRQPVLENKPRCTTLPEGFTPFGLGGGASEAPFLSYLRSRGVSEGQRWLYRMGYVETGQLAGRVVIPSFDALGMVNFWSARSIYANETFRYRLPQTSKDVVSNEHMVDWTEPVYLVEGIFDELAIGPQAISLYGKFMPPTLAKRLVERRPPMVYVCLDEDARVEALDLMGRLVGYDVTCALVEMTGKDPSELGGEAVIAAAASTRPVTGSMGLVGARL